MLTHGRVGGGRSSARSDRRTYQVRTHGCQMNVHDSERLAGLLEAAGYRAPDDGADADVVVFNTCAVRENADNKLYGNLSHLAPAQDRSPTCRSPSAVAWRRRTANTWCASGAVGRRPFGTHNIGSLPALLDRARHNRGPGGDRRGTRGVPVESAHRA